jgi:HSP20 family protein
MVMRFDPFRDIDRLTQQLTGAMRYQATSIPMDAYRRGDTVFVHFDLPGADPTSIDIRVEQNALTVRAERFFGEREGDEVLVRERPEGAFSRQMFLGQHLDLERIQASYDQGVLTLTIPVAETAKPRRIEVQSAGRETQPKAIGVQGEQDASGQVSELGPEEQT